MTFTLYLVPTPLSDPDDITLRALHILREVRAIAMPTADQAVKNLLKTHEISTEIIAYSNVIPTLNSGDVALVSTAGTPGIGDAAHEIVVQAITRGIRVEPLPGASAEITALVLSGLPTEAFVCVGDLPDDLTRYAHERETMIFVVRDGGKALARLMDGFAERRVCIAARLTQPDELIYRGTVREAIRYFRDAPIDGELMLVVQGAPPETAEVWDEARVRMVLREHLRQGEPLKLAAKAVAALAGWDRRTVYALGVDEKQNPP